MIGGFHAPPGWWPTVSDLYPCSEYCLIPGHRSSRNQRLRGIQALWGARARDDRDVKTCIRALGAPGPCVGLSSPPENQRNLISIKVDRDGIVFAARSFGTKEST
jgi:hypothetical protein